MPNRTNRTHVEDTKDPGKVLLPRCNPVLITFWDNKAEDRMPFRTLLDDPLLDICQRSGIKLSVSGPLYAHMNNMAHVFNSSIASRTGWFSWFNCLPSNSW
jgi:hypothetical protein